MMHGVRKRLQRVEGDVTDYASLYGQGGRLNLAKDLEAIQKSVCWKHEPTVIVLFIYLFIYIRKPFLHIAMLTEFRYRGT